MARLLRGAVVSAHQLASEAGASIMKRGGNAVDAAVATSLMLGVVEPAFSGIGGGGFAMVHLPSGETRALDYRETAPARSSADMFQPGSHANSAGPLAVATPGMLAGHAYMLEEFGTMKFADVAEPAIATARTGFSRSSFSRLILKENRNGTLDKVRSFPGSAWIPGVDGEADSSGAMPSLSETLSRLADEGPRKFYEGDIPGLTSEHLRAMGGILSAEDFRKYTAKLRKPVEGTVRGVRVFSMPPPSAGGTLLIQGLRILEELEGMGRQDDKAERLALLADVIRFVLGEKAGFGDPDFVDVTVNQLLSDSSIGKIAGKISGGANGRRRGPANGPGSTSHFCVVDREGAVVSATETIECYFGSGVSFPQLGIIFNDEMHDFDTTPGVPNSVAPGKRPASSMSPTIVLKDDRPYMALGGAGSERIITSILQVMTNVLEKGMGFAEALAAPRIHPVPEGLKVEGGLQEHLPRLRQLWGNVLPSPGRDIFFGGVQAVLIDQEKKTATGYADPRRFGASAYA